MIASSRNPAAAACRHAPRRHRGDERRLGGRRGPRTKLRGGATSLVALACLASCGGHRETRVALIALDGASWRVMNPLMDRGELPTLARMVRDGTTGSLRTLEGVRLISPSIWTTVATGKSPHEHGIVDYNQRPPNGRGPRRLVDSTMRKTEALWTILSSHGLDVTVVGWWATWPAEPVNGFMVSDRYPHTRWEQWHDAEQSTKIVHPPQLEAQLSRLVRSPEDFRAHELEFLLPMTPEIVRRLGDDDWTRYDPIVELKRAYQEQESYVTVARYLLNLRKTRFFTVYLGLVDVAEHFFWHQLEPEHFAAAVPDSALGLVIPNAYRYADRLIAGFMEELGPDYDYLVVSDHSMLPTGRTPLSGSHYRDRVLPAPRGYTRQELNLDGVILAMGPHIGRGTITGATIWDVTPTILYLLGVATAEDMVGQPLRELIAPSFLECNPVQFVPTYDKAKRPQTAPAPGPGESQIKRKLKALGYAG
jgi:hypothetical protein